VVNDMGVRVYRQESKVKVVFVVFILRGISPTNYVLHPEP